MRLVSIGLLILILSSCTANEQNKPQSDAYFNIKGYFETEANRLNQLQLPIDKSVAINGIAEQKIVKIKDFKNELSSFIASDINKASWRGSYTVKKDRDNELYTTTNEKIPIKKIAIHYLNQKIKWIQVIGMTDNLLYHSSDSLTYFPDSLYEIKKTQKIRLLKEKKYVMIGKF
ncbi:hypothetical protein WG904_07280 [Pedobacter sp. Du54]|uniref:hypothetical protein n=1 Tax=Pedobacter anseongensis TaxID=3133439 RepID=UPI0030A5C2A1